MDKRLKVGTHKNWVEEKWEVSKWCVKARKTSMSLAMVLTATAFDTSETSTSWYTVVHLFLSVIVWPRVKLFCTTSASCKKSTKEGMPCSEARKFECHAAKPTFTAQLFPNFNTQKHSALWMNKVHCKSNSKQHSQSVWNFRNFHASIVFFCVWRDHQINGWTLEEGASLEANVTIPLDKALSKLPRIVSGLPTLWSETTTS